MLHVAGPARQTCCSIWHVTCFESHRPGIYIYFVFKSSHGQEISLFSTSPRLALCPLNLPFNAYQGSFPGVRQLGCRVDHSPPSNAEVNNEWSDTSTALICHHGICREGEKKTFLLLVITALMFYSLFPT